MSFGVSTTFLGAFAKWRKATVTFVMSVRPHLTTLLPLRGLSRNLILESIFRSSVGTVRVSFKSDKNNGYFTCRSMNIYDSISLNSS
jgi:hypothetical protein